MPLHQPTRVDARVPVHARMPTKRRSGGGITYPKGRGERNRADTPSPSLLIPVAKHTELRWFGPFNRYRSDSTTRRRRPRRPDHQPIERVRRAHRRARGIKGSPRKIVPDGMATEDANGAELPGAELDGRDDQCLRERWSTSRDLYRLDAHFPKWAPHISGWEKVVGRPVATCVSVEC